MISGSPSTTGLLCSCHHQFCGKLLRAHCILSLREIDSAASRILLAFSHGLRVHSTTDISRSYSPGFLDLA
ncbi:hypothetical protein K458DRAFT_149940 [Lentithecium fluviatile CBS 122367]|uniref:Uncharacterized protein n=1 Tax=Lentithecium fluviatile CBS 122367 TaxID=1168545 RepID=A0A6G1JDJ5_9PLEO|nr:hypothetical protein K458DRAFT_149940 [Lentithecium fluviatile CBS 122367]